MRKLLVFLIFLLVLVVAADRGLHYALEREIANRAAQQYEMATEPEVTIGGFPFLTQVAAGSYDEVHIVTGALTVNEVQLERVDATLRDVRAPVGELLSNPSITAGSVDARVMLPYSELQKRLPEGIVIETDNGAPRITGDLAVSGFSVPVQSDIEVAVDGDTVNVTPTNVQVGESQIDISAVVTERLTFSLQLPQLPFDVRVTGVEALPNGVELSGEGTDVPLAGVAQ
ncbi:LmeA family phospholipid-binding protein [Marinitenerispora sediminis]|uniref:DUF2993 domain-containing protein n=1 Tax=Marinitenerispora sediminis TaxID=1931232 RepID=A0A368TA40_9ACTN|nr:DUF2993 domain-containing protein [Marinitenerispora sediminis]RCV50856.1 DUF2993 domain-containing protein [Marinitenerispora sediminis]RCV56491.1 DUF2993 domain-containing protein [Marinitenerispora sediminis]RCV59574.1 DUF2993 domain-containing protein [Marinitenerispora sediminis]